MIKCWLCKQHKVTEHLRDILTSAKIALHEKNTAKAIEILNSEIVKRNCNWTLKSAYRSLKGN